MEGVLMPYTRRTIEATLSADEKQIHLQIGPFGETVDVADLLDRSSFRRDQMIRNMRIARALAGGPGIESIEFRNAVNQTNRGMELADGRHFIHSVVTNADGTVTVAFSHTSNGQPHTTITIDPIELEEIEEPPIMAIRDNIAAWLRIEGATSLKPILARLNSQRFYA